MSRIQIYTIGSGGPEGAGGPGGGFLQILCGLAAAAGAVALGVLLLPVLGAFLIFVFGAVAALLIGGWIYRKIHGDPLEELLRGLRERTRGSDWGSGQAGPQDAPSRTGREGTMRWKGRKVEVEDIEEKQ